MTDDTPAILLVEDEPLIRLFLAELLEEAGFRVVEAAHANEALTILNSGLPVSVLLTDVDMGPGPDGYELSRTVNRFWPGTEILIMSGRRWPADGDLPPGAAFLAKPCPNEAVVLHVRSAMTRALGQETCVRTDWAPEPKGTVVPFPKTA
ncbi:response regulator [Microvirga pudoricolor]|uniref:response regulator n=1 Tax=Microvirga pudoricolor TaxID=2778729 RepID=UPI0019527653|nr:response regulator [Microvirga pudoricolor]MBM6596263.1 response regulator [Microvirga pudoricolor]